MRPGLRVSLVAVLTLGSVQAEEAPDTVVTARALWNARAPKSYSYIVEHSSTQSISCMTRSSRGQPMNPVKISVLADGVMEVTSWRGDIFVDSCVKGIYTIEKLFNFIESSEGQCDGEPVVEAKFDVAFGFPNYVYERCVLDGDSPIFIRDFRVLD